MKIALDEDQDFYNMFALLSDTMSARSDAELAIRPLECMRVGWPSDLSDGLVATLDDYEFRACHCLLSELLATRWDEPAGHPTGPSRREIAPKTCDYLEQLKLQMLFVPTAELRLMVAFDV